jgi:hypothetical protein
MPTSGEVICGPVTSPVRMSYGVAVTLSERQGIQTVDESAD